MSERTGAAPSRPTVGDAALVVFNPAAGGGRAERFRHPLRQALDRSSTPTHWVETSGPGDAERQVRRWRNAVGRVVAVGGDGTVHEVANGLFDADADRAHIGLGVVHTGTGGDFLRSLRAPSHWPEQLQMALTGPLEPVDVLKVELEGVDGEPRHRISINVAGAGMNGRVVQLANESTKQWGGLATFAWATVRAVVERRMVDAEAAWTGADGVAHTWQGRLAASFFANGQYCGHGMHLGRGGSLRDGLVDVTLIPELPALRMLFGVPSLYQGTVEQIPQVVRARASMLTLSSPDAHVMVDLDGELAGRLPLKIRVIPKALLVAAGSRDL